MKKELSNKFDLRNDINKDAIVENSKHSQKPWKKQIQKIGSFMAGMIMPTVGILIAWGLLAALFLGEMKDGVWVRRGWINFEPIGTLIGPMMKYLIPILIGYTAGNMVYEVRGGMIGGAFTMAAIIGNDFIYANYAANWIIGQNLVSEISAPNQIVGAMVVAPGMVYLVKRFELLYINRIKPGYEMLVRNFSQASLVIAGIFIVFFTWGFIMYGISFVMVKIIEFFTKVPWVFPFMAIFTEPLRAVFLNNALNWGVMIPLGIQEVELPGGDGFSSFFMVGGNPGPGFGLLVAYAIWRKQQRAVAGGSSVIQLIGGIHEVHYVYILTEPIMILSTIAGAFTSLSIIKIFGGGAIAAISPGSLISVIAMSGAGIRILINVIAIFAGALAAFGVASLIMMIKKKANVATMQVIVTDEGISFNQKLNTVSSKNFNWDNVKKITVACDAGVGSSAMAAGIIRKWCINQNLKIEINNCAVKDLDSSSDVVVTMSNFALVAHENAPQAFIYPVKQFLGKDVFTELYDKLSKRIEGQTNSNGN